MLGIGSVREALAVSVFEFEIRSPAGSVSWFSCCPSTQKVESVHSQHKVASSVFNERSYLST